MDTEIKLFYSETDYGYYYDKGLLIDSQGNFLVEGDIIQDKYRNNLYMPDVIVINKKELKRQPLTAYLNKREVYLESLDCKRFIKIGNVSEIRKN